MHSFLREESREERAERRHEFRGVGHFQTARGSRFRFGTHPKAPVQYSLKGTRFEVKQGTEIEKVGCIKYWLYPARISRPYNTTTLGCVPNLNISSSNIVLSRNAQLLEIFASSHLSLLFSLLSGMNAFFLSLAFWSKP